MKIEEAIKQKQFANEHDKLVLNLIYTGNWILTINGRALKSFGLTTQQYNVLRILKGQHPKPAPVGLVNERMLDQMSNASRLVEKLRLKGYVERTTCPDDRRQVDIKLTQEGLDILSEATAHMNQISENIYYELSDEEAKQVNALLDKFRRNGKEVDINSQ